jgi:hypothetical protein
MQIVCQSIYVIAILRAVRTAESALVVTDALITALD